MFAATELLNIAVTDFDAKNLTRHNWVLIVA